MGQQFAGMNMAAGMPNMMAAQQGAAPGMMQGNMAMAGHQGGVVPTSMMPNMQVRTLTAKQPSFLGMKMKYLCLNIVYSVNIAAV